MLPSEQISRSIKKIISQCQPEPRRSPAKSTSLNLSRQLSSLKLQPLRLARRKTETSASSSPSPPKRGAELRKVLKRYNYHHIPTNASKSCQQESSQPSSSSPSEARRGEPKHERYHSYADYLMERENEEECRRLIVLRQVICENVKRKNQAMKIYSKKRIKISF